MKTIIALITLLIVAPLCFAQGENAFFVKDKMKEVVENKEVIGIAGGLVKNDTLVWTASHGMATPNAPYSTNTINRTASITKPMTAIAVMQLVEAGKVILDAPMATYVQEFNTAALNKITVRQVLEHSSGLPGYKNKKEAANKKQYNSLTEALHYILKKELLFAPGTDFNYTSYGYVSLGVLIERVSGLTYGDYLKQQLFNPVGMTQTSLEEYGQPLEGKANVYHQKKPGKIEEITDSNISDRLPGGGVQSTVNDLLKFGNAVLNNTLISKESLKELTTSSGLKKEGNAYGMGWYLYGPNPDFGNIFGHNGAQYGCSAFLFIFPESNMVTVAMTNTSDFEKIGGFAMAIAKIAAELE